MAYLPFTAGQKLTTLLLNTRIIEEIMPWTNLSAIGSFTANGSAGSPTPRMRKLRIMGTEVWEFEGRIALTGIAASGSATVFNFNVGYRVAAERGAMMYGYTNAYAHRVGTVPAGDLRVGTPGGATATTGVMLDGWQITNPV